MEVQEILQKIEQQQKPLKAGSAPWCVGEQLKDIVRTAASAVAEIIGTDLDCAGMGIVDCEKKIADFAKANKQGYTGFCGPQDADRIVREFYGVASDQSGTLTLSDPDLSAKRKAVSIVDFL